MLDVNPDYADTPGMGKTTCHECGIEIVNPDFDEIDEPLCVDCWADEMAAIAGEPEPEEDGARS